MREKQTHTKKKNKKPLKRTKTTKKRTKKTILYELFGNARNLTLSRILPKPVLPSLLTFYLFTFLLFYFQTVRLVQKKGERNSLIALPFALNGYFYVFLV